MSNETPAFYTTTGRLTAYGLACGYIETTYTGVSGTVRVELYREHGTYHVRAFNEAPDAAVFRLYWNTFDTLTAAFRAFYSLVRQYKH